MYFSYIYDFLYSAAITFRKLKKIIKINIGFFFFECISIYIFYFNKLYFFIYYNILSIVLYYVLESESQ